MQWYIFKNLLVFPRKSLKQQKYDKKILKFIMGYFMKKVDFFTIGPRDANCWPFSLWVQNCTKIKKIFEKKDFDCPKKSENYFLDFGKNQNYEKRVTLYPRPFVYFWSKIKSCTIKLIFMMSCFLIILTDCCGTY